MSCKPLRGFSCLLPTPPTLLVLGEERLLAAVLGREVDKDISHSSMPSSLRLLSHNGSVSTLLLSSLTDVCAVMAKRALRPNSKKTAKK